MVNVGIVGITGYTGEELIKVLARHKKAKIAVLAGRSTAKQRPLGEIYPSMAPLHLTCEALDIPSLTKRADVIFLALPHRVSFGIVPDLLATGKKVIDLSADFRLHNAAVYEKWYGEKHTAQHLLEEAVYGLPELYRKNIKTARLIANPGCYPTTVILACAPLFGKGLVDLSSPIVDAKSGISGAGRKAADEYFKKEHPNLRPYSVGGAHRHIPEIEQELSKAAGEDIRVTFTPQVIPVERGMLSSVYMDMKGKQTTAELLEIYKAYYNDEPFVRILPEGKIPEMRNVVNTNFCEIGLKVDTRTNRLIVISAIDNLIKGASGQAVQNMNIMMGFDETEGLV